MNSQDLLPFQELVRQRCGLQLETQAESALMLALQTRMTATGEKFPSAYYTRLLSNTAEFDELVSLLTINETYFYREAQQLELLTERLLPDLLAKGCTLPLRILSAGCSTGEEPYSIAMAIREKFGENAARMVAIVAGDIDRHVLRKARHAHYSEYAFRGFPAALRERYFRPVPGHGYRLDDSIRQMVEFHPLNLLADTLPEKLSNVDIIFFRNVSIYFDTATRERIQRTLHAAMKETGILILGTTETLANDLGVFRLVEDDGHFYFRKGDAPPPPDLLAHPVPKPELASQQKKIMPPAPRKVHASKPQPHRQNAPVLPVAPAPRPPDGKMLAAARTRLRDRQYGAALEQLAPLRQTAPGNVEAMLLESYALLQLRRFTEAAQLARQVLEHDQWSVDAMMLLGFVAKWQDDGATALGHFKTAAYTRPDCWPAHYYLAGQLQENDAAKARREFRTTLSQLAANPDPDGGLQLPLNLPVEDIRFLCERRSSDSGGTS